ncbi:MAG: hypothetical protein M1837_000436 [Sclerophora amabilis]|nr:MAG: hypothetical protein M1837_000436 [Sclerophora amabilis]
MKLYIVEHIDPELGPWSTLEYIAIARESSSAGSKFCLSSVPTSLEIPEELRKAPGIQIENRSIESLPSIDSAKVCLLDPAAVDELNPRDGDQFDVFLFGGILGLPYQKTRAQANDYGYSRSSNENGDSRQKWVHNANQVRLTVIESANE